MSLGLSENLWCSAQTSPQHPTPTMIMLVASTNSQIQSEAGSAREDNIDAIMRSNYVVAICFFIGCHAVVLGIWGLLKK